MIVSNLIELERDRLNSQLHTGFNTSRFSGFKIYRLRACQVAVPGLLLVYRVHSGNHLERLKWPFLGQICEVLGWFQALRGSKITSESRKSVGKKTSPAIQIWAMSKITKQKDTNRISILNVYASNLQLNWNRRILKLIYTDLKMPMSSSLV